MRLRFALLLSFPLWAFSQSLVAAGLKVIDLRCEYALNPLGVDSPAPRLFWKLASHEAGQGQTAWQALAASSPALLRNNTGDLWDSGKVRSDQTVQIPYAGKPLGSAQQVFWKVRAWDRRDVPSAWSPIASWTMGLLTPGDWRAQWIGSQLEPAPQSLVFRHEFTVKPRLKRALAFVCGLGCYELSVNGRKLGDALFPPGWTKYDKTCLYDTYDVTGMLRPGQNAAGLLLGNGMYNVVGGRYTKFTGSFGPLKAIAQLRLEYEDGTSETIGTDTTWRQTAGPLTFSSVYGGEDYDARLEQAGWNKPGFDDSRWSPAVPVSGPGGSLKGLSCAAPPIRAFETLKPVKVTPLRPGVQVYDLGQNVSLMPRFKVRGVSGSVVRITPAELLGKNGAVDRGSCGGGQAYWQYTLAGTGTETWFPKFFYHGSRFLQVECQAPAGAPLPVVVSLQGVVVHSDCAPVGTFECSSDLFNRVYRLIRWAQLSNMMSVMTDCPHREKLGWLEEDHLNGPALRYNFEMAPLFTKMMNDMADSQLDNGLVPDIAPEYVKFDGGFRDSPEWGSACILVPWQQYEFDGDLDLLRRHYEVMARYVEYLGNRATNYLVSHGLGDWYDIGPNPPGVAQLTPVPLTATAFYYYDTWVLSRVAALLGKETDARKYEELAGRIRGAFNEKFFKADQGTYATGSQCANAVPLVMGLVEPADYSAVLSNLVRDLRNHGNALTAGDVGYRYLLRALADGGRSDVVSDINNQSTKPGYGFQLAHGATSLTEAWDAGRNSSQNHFMLGQLMEWFYHDLAGIAPDPAGPGFQRLIIKPAPVGDLAWVRATYESLHGPITTDWRRKGKDFSLHVDLPPGTSATVYVPAVNAQSVRATGGFTDSPRGFLREETGYAVYLVKSGSHTFKSRCP